MRSIKLKKKKLDQLVGKRISHFQAHWQGVKSLEPESIHEFRVEYKKLRALVRLLQTRNKKIEIGDSIKSVYKAAGPVRDRQIQKQKIADLILEEPIPVYQRILCEELNSKGEELTYLTRHEMVLFLPHERLKENFPNELPLASIREYIVHLLMEIQIILWLSFKKDEYLHSCRKFVKDIQYLLDMFDDPAITAGLEILPDPEVIRSVAIELGNYNDHTNSLQFLGAAYLNRIPTEEKKILSAIRSDWQKKKTRMKNEIIASLERSFQNLFHLHTS